MYAAEESVEEKDSSKDEERVTRRILSEEKSLHLQGTAGAEHLFHSVLSTPTESRAAASEAARSLN
eukprot:9261596-Karenia_brevis.AAC.1